MRKSLRQMAETALSDGSFLASIIRFQDSIEMEVKEKIIFILQEDLASLGYKLDIDSFVNIVNASEDQVDSLVRNVRLLKEEILGTIEEKCGSIISDWFELSFQVWFLKESPELIDTLSIELLEKSKILGIPTEKMMNTVTQIRNSMGADAVSDFMNYSLQVISNFNFEQKRVVGNKVFIVHGHDNAAKYEMARTLEKSGFEAIVLHEQPSSGKTIIEKIEAHTDVSFAVVLYTPCDMGRAKEENQERPRARQNVVFEHGYLIGKLGRKHVSALVKGNTETPGDISGVVYIPMDDSGSWKIALAKEMIDAGLPVDMNKFCI